jgi:mRNA interferase MazF
MDATIKISVSIPKTLCTQSEMLARYLKISRNQLFKNAIENFIRDYQIDPLVGELDETDQDWADVKPEAPNNKQQAVINQGDIYWVQLETLSGAEPRIRHPHVVIQDNVFNHSRIDTVVACALTSNRKRVSIPGNVLLEAGEANLVRQSVVEVSKISTIHKIQLGEYIGSLTDQRINQILAGMRFIQQSYFTRPSSSLPSLTDQVGDSSTADLIIPT